MKLSPAGQLPLIVGSSLSPKVQVAKLSACQQAAVAKTDESPLSFVRSLFPAGRKRVRGPATMSTNFDTEGYDMESVRAIRSNDVDKLQEMLDNGKSFDACNTNGESLLHLACRRSDVATVKFLVQKAKVNVNVRDNMGRGVLHDVCWRPAPEKELMNLLVAVISPELLLAEDMRGHTPFDYARKVHWDAWIQLLRENKDLISTRIQIIA